jgi:hypothetical protein
MQTQNDNIYALTLYITYFYTFECLFTFIFFFFFFLFLDRLIIARFTTITIIIIMMMMMMIRNLSPPLTLTLTLNQQGASYIRSSPPIESISLLLSRRSGLQWALTPLSSQRTSSLCSRIRRSGPRRPMCAMFAGEGKRGG